MALENVTNTQSGQSSKRRSKKSVASVKADAVPIQNHAPHSRSVDMEEEETKADDLDSPYENAHLKEIQKYVCLAFWFHPAQTLS